MCDEKYACAKELSVIHRNKWKKIPALLCHLYIMTCWCAACLAKKRTNGKWLSNQSDSVRIFQKALSTFINNIVIIISTYRSYEYYSVCAMEPLPLYLSACSSMCTYIGSLFISIYWKVSTNKNKMRMTALALSPREKFVFSNICESENFQQTDFRTSNNVGTTVHLNEG